MEGTVHYIHEVPAVRKDVTDGRVHHGPSGGSAGAEEDVRTSLGTLRRQLGTLIGWGYAVRDPKARLFGLRPKRFDSMAALEADDQHEEESR
jgi:hypothetical protein